MDSAAAKAASRTINEIGRQLGERSGAWRVVLFGSRARGDARESSDYDLYVEVDAPRDSLRVVQHQMRAAIGERRPGWSIDLHVHPPGEIERRSADPGTIEWDVAREGILLFADARAPRLSVPPSRVREQSPNAPASVAEWLDAAERDMRAARALLDEVGLWPEVCFHVQQTCEKGLKALLVSRGSRPPRTHDLEVLVARFRTVGGKLPAPDEDWKRLSEYAVLGRYPGSKIDEPEARMALAAAERIAAVIWGCLNPPDS